MKSFPSLLLWLAPLLSSVVALGQNATITTVDPAPGLLQLAGKNIDGQILLSANDWWGVIRAAEDLATDFGKVTGKNLTLGNWGSIGPVTNSTNGTSLAKREVLGIAPARRQSAGWQGPPTGGSPERAGPRPWGHPGPSSGGHNETLTDGVAGDTTVYYTYNPVTSFVNVSTPQAKSYLRKLVLKKSKVHHRPSPKLHRPNPP
jgi:hypothetical protein